MFIPLAYSFLPQKYYYDGGFIRAIMKGNAHHVDNSYQNTANIYSFVGFGSDWHPWLVGIICLSVVFLSLALLGKAIESRIFLLPYIFFALWLVPMVVYLGQYSKELIAFITVCSFVAIGLKFKKGKWFWASIIILIYAFGIRFYWYLILAFFLAFYTVFNFKIPNIWKPTIFLITTIIAFALSYSLNGVYITDARVGPNFYRQESTDAVTIVNNVIPNSSVYTDIANAFINWPRFLFPIPLLFLGAVQHLAFFILQIVSVLLCIVAIAYMLRWRSLIARKEMDEFYFLMSWIIAFSFVQACFEPDYGSFVKHQVVLVPVIFLLLNKWQQQRYYIKQHLAHQIASDKRSFSVK